MRRITNGTATAGKQPAFGCPIAADETRAERPIEVDMLNSRMNGQSTLNPLGLPSDWAPSHPFRKAYDAGSAGGGFDFRRLWQLTEFPDSQADRGIRLADVIAHTARRYFRDGVAREAFELIERKTVRGTTLTIVDPAPDAVLSKVLSPLGLG